MLRVDPGQHILDSMILYIVPEIKISHRTGLNIVRSVLEAIKDGETPLLKKMTSHRALRFIDPTLVSTAILQLQLH